jgi:uncharacterized protein (DUF111 family)
MIFIDATEGLSGDMLLAAMIGLLDPPTIEEVSALLEAASESVGLEFRLLQVDEAGEIGLGISYLQPEPTHYGASYDECFSRLAGIERELGSGSPVGRAILQIIFDAEAEAHGAPARQVHLHEIGRPQALLNMAGIGFLSTKLQEMGADGFICSTIATGRGIVVVSHGALRIPAPAASILLRGLTHVPGDSPGERATPSGIAAVKALASSQSDEIPKNYSRKAIGFGTKRFAGRLGRTSLVWL